MLQSVQLLPEIISTVLNFIIIKRNKCIYYTVPLLKTEMIINIL